MKLSPPPASSTVDEIIAVGGGVGRTGEIAGVDHSTVIGWRRRGRVPAVRAIKLSDALGIPLHRIRADLWRPPTSQAAE